MPRRGFARQYGRTGLLIRHAGNLFFFAVEVNLRRLQAAPMGLSLFGRNPRATGLTFASILSASTILRLFLERAELYGIFKNGSRLALTCDLRPICGIFPIRLSQWFLAPHFPHPGPRKAGDGSASFTLPRLCGGRVGWGEFVSQPLPEFVGAPSLFDGIARWHCGKGVRWLKEPDDNAPVWQLSMADSREDGHGRRGGGLVASRDGDGGLSR